MKSPLDPCIKGFALVVKAICNWSMKKSLRWAARNWDIYTLYITKQDLFRRSPEVNTRYVYKEFIFQGFVPLDKFKPKRGFSYITSNRLIEGKILIYPVHYSIDYRFLKKGYLNPYYIIGRVGVPGFTKVEERWK